MTLPTPFAKFDKEEFDHACSEVPKLVLEAVRRIEHHPFKHEELFIGHSGGKDSVTVTYLTDLALGKGSLPLIHNPKPTGIPNAVHPLTQQFLYTLASERPILYSPDIPDHCQTQIDGTRISEWTREDGRSVDIIKDGESVSRRNMTLYMEHGLFNRNFIYPIYDWEDIDVWAAIYVYNIPYSPEYDL
jgi:3'-phosphoadenosine 5'-phosphosulfate sulfotransferase (PAPS reductase)/FAD synthetase